MVYGCMGTSSFGAICTLKKKQKTKQKITNKNPVRTVAYLLLWSNTRDSSRHSFLFYSFYFYLPEKCISQLHQNKYAQNSSERREWLCVAKYYLVTNAWATGMVTSPTERGTFTLLKEILFQPEGHKPEEQSRIRQEERPAGSGEASSAFNSGERSSAPI